MPHGSAAVLRTVVHSPAVSRRALHFTSHPPLFVPMPSQELCSWSNVSTARYDSVKYPMPLSLDDDALAKIGRTVQERLQSPTLGWDLVYLRQVPEGFSRTLGHAMPAGVAYGGMTGGQGINYVFGAPAAITGQRRSSWAGSEKWRAQKRSNGARSER